MRTSHGMLLTACRARSVARSQANVNKGLIWSICAPLHATGVVVGRVEIRDHRGVAVAVLRAMLHAVSRDLAALWLFKNGLPKGRAMAENVRRAARKLEGC
jgi:hypothetical protein